MILMKFAHDHLRYKHAKYIDRYVDIVGRLSALLIGTIAVDSKRPLNTPYEFVL